MARIKGSSLIKIVKVLRKNRGAAEELLDARLHHYLEERLLVSEWYPDEDYLGLLRSLGCLVGPMVKGDVWEFIGVQGAHEDFTTLYAAFVRKGDPERTLGKADRIWSVYRDTGRMRTVRVAPGHMEQELLDYPLACSELCGTITGYNRELLRLCGAKSIDVELLSVVDPSEGPCRWSMRFDA